MSRVAVGRIERGQVSFVSFGRLEDRARALDGQLDVDFRWRGEALDRLIDERLAALLDLVYTCSCKQDG